ncbi:MAG: hypothetical protein HC904_11435 [Blastochloris sp.]|nr:hypothetical protein [Blastochloris sp.]
MKSSATSKFWKAYADLPAVIQQVSRKQYQLWLADPRHPSLQFKKVGPFWSVRVTDDYRSLALLKEGTYYWFWIGTHAEYNQILKGK